jgi:predicted esterase
VDAALAALPADVSARLDRLSPARAIPGVHARVILVHGYRDTAVPYTESLRLAAARPAGTTVVLLHAIGHVEAAPVPAWTTAREVFRLWLAVYTLQHP